MGPHPSILESLQTIFACYSIYPSLPPFHPHLDFLLTVWNLHLMKNTCKLEAVQRKATKLTLSFHTSTCSEMLQKLNLPMQLTLSLIQNELNYDLQNLKHLGILVQRLFFTVNANPAGSNGLSSMKIILTLLLTSGHG